MLNFLIALGTIFFLVALCMELGERNHREEGDKPTFPWLANVSTLVLGVLTGICIIIMVAAIAAAATIVKDNALLGKLVNIMSVEEKSAGDGGKPTETSLPPGVSMGQEVRKLSSQ